MQTKPLRNYGIDVTQTSFKPIMEELGLEKSVNELTQAEKEILRYIATLRQAKNAMGDFANTIDSPANQLKVLKQQFYEMQAAIGNLFVGAFARILPYVNGIIMVIKELAKAIATIFGIRMKDYNQHIATYGDGLEDYSDSLDDIAGSAGGASDAIKALKRQTLAFDQINNLTSPTPSGSSGGGGGGSLVDGIDQRLLDALKDYENGMERVRMKATKIRDRIMEWLGFQKQINEETHETYFTYNTTNKTIVQIAKEIAHNLANMLNYYTNRIDWSQLGHYLALGLNTAFGFLDTFIRNYDWRNLGNKIAEFVNKAIEETDFSAIGRVLTSKMRIAILSLLGFIEKFDFKEFASKLADLINSAIKNIPVEELAEGLNKLLDGVWTTIKELVKQIDWGALIDTVVTFFKELDWGAKLLVLAPVIASALGTLFGSQVIQDIISQMIVKAIMNGILSGNFNFGGGSGAGAGTAGAGGLSLSGAGYAAGAAIGTYLTIEGYKTTNAQLDNLFGGKPVDLTLGISDDKSYSENLWAGSKNVLSQLTFLTAGNGMLGKVAIGKSLVDSIKNSGIKGTLENITKSLKDTIGIDFSYMWKPFEKGIDVVDKANKALFGFGKTTYQVSDDIKKNASVYFDTLIEADKQQRIMKAATEGNYEEIKKIIKENVEESTDHVKNSLVEQTNAVEGELGTDLLDKWSILALNSRDKYKEGIKELPEDLQDRIQAATGVIVSATPGVVQYFEDLGKLSETDMMTELKKLPTDLQQEIIDKLKEKGVKIPEEIQAGIDSEPDPKVELDTSSQQEVQNKVDLAIRYVSGTIGIGLNLPSTWAIQNAVNGALSGVSAILKLTANANGGVFANGRWQPIQAYANGGMPSGGSLFMAREAGPELVGKIGRHTAVMNNNQIVDSVKAGVYEAVSAAMSEGGMGQVQIDLHTDEGVVVDRINKVTRQTGVCPIEI